MTLTDTGAHSRGFKGAHTHTHEGPRSIRDLYAAETGLPVSGRHHSASGSSSSRQPGDTARLTLPPPNSAHTQTAGQGRCQRRRPTKGSQRRLRASARGLTLKTRADGATKAPHQQHHHHQQHQGDNRLGGGEPLTQFHSTLLGTPRDIIIINKIKATTDSAAGSHLPSFIQLYWAPQQTRLGWWHGEE